MLEAIESAVLLIGAFFVLVGSIGLLRLPDFLSRLHAPTKATTLGLGGLLLASMIHFSAQRGDLSLHELLVILFLFLTAPVGAYMLAKAARHLQAGSAGSDSVTREPNSKSTDVGS
jgi:multicomponent K+:H+ antiporter subunit G